MPQPLLRKKKTEKVYDPVSAETWAAGAKASALVLDMIEMVALTNRYGNKYRDLCDQLATVTGLTPCASVAEVRTQPKAEWDYDDFLMASRVAQGLRRIVTEEFRFVPVGEFEPFDTLREKTAAAVLTFIETVEKYTKLVRRERAQERLSGLKSRRRR